MDVRTLNMGNAADRGRCGVAGLSETQWHPASISFSRRIGVYHGSGWIERKAPHNAGVNLRSAT